MRKFKCKIPIDKFLRFQSSWKCACNSSKFNLILVPKRPRSFWEARRITTSGMVQFFGACAKNSFRILSQSYCQSWLWACAEWWEVRERGLSTLVLLRGRDSWCWLTEARPLGTGIVQSFAYWEWKYHLAHQKPYVLDKYTHLFLKKFNREYFLAFLHLYSPNNPLNFSFTVLVTNKSCSKTSLEG